MKLIKETVEAGHGEVEFEVVEGCPAVELSQEHPCIQLAQKPRKNLVSCRNESYRRPATATIYVAMVCPAGYLGISKGRRFV